MNLKNTYSWFLQITMIVLISAGLSVAQDLPTAKSIATEMGAGWNLGNTMELPIYHQPIPTKALIDSVKKAGFKTIRIPGGWNDGHSDPTTYAIDPTWMAQVKKIVDYSIQDSLFVVLNIHWDGGWLEGKIDSAATNPQILATMKAKQGTFWKQIATTFKDYDRHLLFASANEPGVEQQANLGILMTMHQIFVDTVRATGGNNASRTLIFQGPNTNIEKTSDWVTAPPTDKIADRLMVEVHFYPFQYCLMDQPANWGTMAYPFYYWGKDYHSTTDTIHNPTWGEESYVDSQFNMMKPKFLDKNIPVLIGEFGAAKRLSPTGANLRLAILSRRHFYNYVTKAAISRGMIPVVWDAGNQGNGTMSVFERNLNNEGAIYDLGLLNAIRDGAGLPKLAGDTSSEYATGDSCLRILYSAKDSGRGQVSLPVFKKDMTPYDSILVRAYVKGTTQYDSAGIKKNGFFMLSLVTMSNNWQWREKSIGALTMDNWKTYSIPVSSDTTDHNALVSADPAAIDFFALQARSKAFRGAIYVDWIVFKSKNGTCDTVYTFNERAPKDYNDNVDTIQLFPVADVPADKKWETATTTIWNTTSVKRRTITNQSDMQIIVLNETIQISGISNGATPAVVALIDLQGRTVWSHIIKNLAVANELKIPNHQSGSLILQIHQGSRDLVRKVITLY